ncbi:unnamed protein product [Rotaria sp. Silwood1]|nr:unnamed protein product [Rotaria sp. Silwood1]
MVSVKNQFYDRHQQLDDLGINKFILCIMEVHFHERKLSKKKRGGGL